MLEHLLGDLADDQYQDEVLEDDEGVLQEVQDGVRLIQEEARVEAVTEILRRTLILQNKTIWEISYEALLWSVWDSQKSKMKTKNTSTSSMESIYSTSKFYK